MNYFYSENINEGFGSLSEEESGHVARVLRKKEGDDLVILDGNGKRYSCVITSVSKKKVEFEVKGFEEFERRNKFVELIIAPTKNISRIEWLLEKVTEIGVDRIVFIVTDHSERKIIKLDRLKKIVLSAMKQSGQFYLPEVTELKSFKEVCDIVSPESSFRGACEDSVPLLKDVELEGEHYSFWVGPEGDFSDREIEILNNLGVKPVSLGSSRLRTETAGLVAVTQLNFL